MFIRNLSSRSLAFPQDLGYNRSTFINGRDNMTDEMKKVPDNETANVNGGAVAAPAQVPDFPEHPYKVDPAKCVCCGTCVALCPVKAIAMTELSAVIRGHCIECGTCESACPANAIFKNT